MKPVDNCPIPTAPMTDEVRRDLKEARDSEMYQDMLFKVEQEMISAAAYDGFGDYKPDGRKMHEEAMRRLRNG